MNLLNRFIKPVYAHCDVPCGIYETDTMKHAAETVLKMCQKIDELEVSSEKSDAHNNYIRMVLTKEEHARKCKEQIYILWSDYFKPEHLEKFPDLHNKFWMAAKQCGKAKQSINIEEAQKLVDMVAELNDMFSKSKQ